MTIEEITAILRFLLQYGLEGVIAGSITFILVKNFLPGYLSEKGKNLATKEDISGITKEIEKVKSDYNQILEAVKAQHQLRLAAVEKRLQAHQEAFCLWRKINGALGKDSLHEVINECDEWWGNNSLYLEPEPREAFLAAWVSAKDLKWHQDNSEQKLVYECYEKIAYAGDAITNAVALPKINEFLDAKKPFNDVIKNINH